MNNSPHFHIMQLGFWASISALIACTLFLAVQHLILSAPVSPMIIGALALAFFLNCLVLKHKINTNRRSGINIKKSVEFRTWAKQVIENDTSNF